MSICSRCQTSFNCAMVDQNAGDAPCWCTHLPALPLGAPAEKDKIRDASCFCPACLRALIEQAQHSMTIRPQ